MTHETTSFLLASPAALARVLAFSSASILGAVWLVQSGGGIAPCPLCLQQRYAYYIGAALAVFIALMVRRAPESAALFAVLFVLFAGNGVLGGYHVGIEYGWWQGGVCSGDISAIHTTQDLLASLADAAMPSCADAAFRFLGLSLAGYNVLASMALAGFAFFGYTNYARAKG